MRYKITIQQETTTPEDTYAKYEDIYEQIVEDLEVRAVANLINKADEPRTGLIEQELEGAVLQN